MRSAPVEQDRVLAPVDTAKTAPLSGRLPGWVYPARIAGPVTPTLQLDHLTLLLARSPERERAFRQQLEDQQNQASPEYHRWLTPQQIGEQYGVTAHDLEAVQDWLASQGLRVEQLSKSRTVVNFSGTVAQVEAAFSVRFERYQLAASEAAAGTPRERLSVSGQPRVPRALAPVIAAVGGLSQIPVHPYGHAKVERMRERAQFADCSGVGSNCQHFLKPQDFATIFDIPAVNLLGYEQRIAIIGRSRIDTSDIDAFVSLSELAAAMDYASVLIPPNGSEPGTTNDGDQLEATIDVTRAVGTAPWASEDLIVSGDSATEDGIYLASLYEVDTVLDPVMNLSFGACEADAGMAGVALYDNLASQAAGEGISIFVSSGDAGAAGCDRNNATPPVSQVKSPNYICSTSYVTCVGGTEFNDTANPAQYWSPQAPTGGGGTPLGYIPEGGWNEPSYIDANGSTAYQASASGGGVSSLIAKPAWQTGPGVPADGFRDTPDVSFPASAHDGYFACVAFVGGDCNQGSFAYVFGTSAGAPAMAAITAILNTQRSSSVGNLNPTLYSLAGNPALGAFHDATIESSGLSVCSLGTPSLCNNSTPAPTSLAGGLPGYALTDGYDQVTGLGSLDVEKFLSAAQPPLLTPILTVSTNLISANSSQSFPLSVTVTGSAEIPTGTVTWTDGLGEQLGQTAPLVNGVASQPSVQLGQTGVTTIFIAYSGDSVYASGLNEQQAYIVPAPGSLVPSIAIAASPSSFTVEEPVVFTAVLQGSGSIPTGSVAFFDVDSHPLGMAVPVVNGVATSAPQAFLRTGGPFITAQYLGDAQYQGISATFAFSANPILAPTFTITPTSLQVKAGQTTGNTSAISVASQNSYTGTIRFTCKVVYSAGTANDPPTCSLGALTTLDLSPSAPNGMLAATFSTTAPSGAGSTASLPGDSDRSTTTRVGFAGVAGWVSLVLLAARRRARRHVCAWFAVIVVCAGLASAVVGCGGGGGGGSPSVPVVPATPGTTTGNYLVTLMGSSPTYTSTVTFNLTVQ